MGAKCCMPVKDDIPMLLREKYRVPHELYTRRNNRCSPSWSFRCDNRTHIEDIVDSPAWLSHNHSGTIGSEFKSVGDTEIEGLSAGSSPSDTFQTHKWQKFPNELGTPENSIAGAADHSAGSSSSPEEKDINEFPSTAGASDSKPSSSTAPADHPSSSKTCSLPSSDPTSSRKPGCSPDQCSKQASEARTPTTNSLNEEGAQFMLSFYSNDLSTGESHGGSSDGWSMRFFSDLVVSSHMDSRTNTQPSASSFSSDSQTCRVCSKLLKERASWKGNDIAVVAVLACGHVYHAECLESVTPEASKFDPSCPTCSNGENSAPKPLVKVGSKTRTKNSRRAVADLDVDGNLILERQKSRSCILKNLRRHLSIGSRPMRSGPESESSRKKGFWARYR